VTPEHKERKSPGQGNKQKRRKQNEKKLEKKKTDRSALSTMGRPSTHLKNTKNKNKNKIKNKKKI